MNKRILNTGIQEFIKNNWRTDIVSLLLKKPIFEGVSQKELVEQLEAKKKCQKKLPLWFETRSIYYPNKLNIEQSSSEITANYKTGIVKGKSLLDLTGGLGVDSYYFAKTIKQVDYCEIDEKLAEITTHNFRCLGVQNICTINTDGIGFLENSTKKFDWIYLDPSRRHKTKGKVFRISDATPNILALFDLLFAKGNKILLKTSPLLDLQAGIAELKRVSEVHIVAVNNEVKELLWVLENTSKDSLLIKAINLKKEKIDDFEFRYADERAAIPVFSEPLKYLYEPNAAILKSGAFKLVGNRFSLLKLHPNSHLYTSNDLYEFPGRIFYIKQIHDFSKKSVKDLKIEKCNLVTRNFPESVKTLRKRFGLKEGGDRYLFFTKTKESGLIILDCVKI